MNEQVLYELLAKKLAGEATPTELRQVDEWLAESPDHPALYEQMAVLWQQTAPVPLRTLSDQDAAFDRLLRRIDQPLVKAPRRSLRLATWVGAASIILVVALGWWLYPLGVSAPVLAQQVTPKGARSEVRLPDGSIVWLNADSRLEYPRAFDGNTREVTLVGEAFFDVVKNPSKPFIIKLQTGTIRVLGTSFNVKAYPGDSIVETTVVTGKVAFIPNPTTRQTQASDTLFVLPNHKVVQDLQAKIVLDKPTVAALNHAWMQDKLVFMDTPLSEVARTLERRYGIAVVLEREALSRCPLTATFEGQSLKEVMELIAMTKQFDYQLANNQFIIKGKGCEVK
jgi:ferric-dicitrate binding protein FerR (iron transport regulator)